jgi:hypothetical protein
MLTFFVKTHVRRIIHFAMEIDAKEKESDGKRRKRGDHFVSVDLEDFCKATRQIS